MAKYALSGRPSPLAVYSSRNAMPASANASRYPASRSVSDWYPC